MKLISTRLIARVSASALLATALPAKAFADRFFVLPVVFKGETNEAAFQFEESIRSSIPGDGRHVLVSSIANSQFQIEPRIVEFEQQFQLSLDKRQGSTIVYSKSISLPKGQSIQEAGSWLATQVVAVQPYSNRSEIGSLISTGAQPPIKRSKLISHWYFAYGPASSSGLNSEGVLVNVNIGRSWEIDRSLYRVYYNNTSGTNEDADAGLRGIGVSAGQLLSSLSSSPFVNADLIYGATTYTIANSAAAINAGSNTEKQDIRQGFIYGVGGGMMFNRSGPLAFETALQYNSFMGSTPNGVPSTFGLRIGIHW
jgi:hypothetical protein